MRESRKPAAANVLVADDDPVSLRFLEIALRELGCNVTAVADGAAAIAATKAARFDLLLLDRRMPDCGGADLLRALRDAGIAAPALATSAELDADIRAKLMAAGYADALAKPIRVDVLAHAVSAHCALAQWSVAETTPAQSERDTALLDDASALSAVGGDITTLRALRGLLARDLDAMQATGVPTDMLALAEALHRLRAACRYCGANALEQSAASVESAIRTGRAPLPEDLSAFVRCCTETKFAIEQSCVN